MVGKIKAYVQRQLYNRCYNRYVAETERQKDCYRQWALINEGWKSRSYPAAPEVALQPMDALQGGVTFADREGITLFYDARGSLEEKAVAVVGAFFRENPHVQVAYADEDVTEDGLRKAPWFKPQWSPDTLLSFQYMGHAVAIRSDLLPDAYTGSFYDLLLYVTKEITDAGWIKANDEKKAIAPIGKVLIHMPPSTEDDERKCGFNLWERMTVSTIIPSKDNPDVLKTCISSLLERTDLSGIMLEIIVVDNGSTEDNRKRLEEMSASFNFRYIYEPQPFNFSRMCNLGVSKATGQYLLFLNDDMEIVQADWLKLLLDKAKEPHVGAVGAKLIYPGTDIIQHIGITNIKVGPVHKLLKKHDGESHYHGQNRHVYDMIGVTAACLLIDRDKYRRAGGLTEEMAVAYNDVELNFALHDLGYYNVFRGDVMLYHHESLSRGDDNLSDEKWVRLLKEKDILYRKHPHLKSFDPFYSPNLAVHSNLYLPAFMYEYEKRDYYTKLKAFKGPLPEKWENGCLTVNTEHAREEKKLEFDEKDDTIWIEGWSYVLGMDNARYQRKLLLAGEKGQIYEAAVLPRYRKDVVDILPDETNVALAGFVCRIPKQDLIPDTYRVAMVASDMCSMQKLYRMSEKTFTV